MARKKKPENETPEQQTERKLFEQISNFSKRNEKTSWNRKMENMVKLLAKIQPIEEQIIELQAQKIPLLDEVSNLRESMVDGCIHPIEYLVNKKDHVLCKFCGRKITVND